MFLQTRSRETSGLLGKHNKLFPLGPYIKCIMFIGEIWVRPFHFHGGVRSARSGAPYVNKTLKHLAKLL